MAEINKKDLISDDALKAPLELSENLEVLLKTIEKLKVSTKSSEAVIGLSKSTGELKNETAKLSSAQTELEKIQKAYTTSTQRLGDEYISTKRALAAINDEVKSKITLGEREARQINAQNASLNVLGAALEKNRKAYAELHNEHARTSKSGVELLKIIQAQDKEFKALNDSIGKHQAHVGGYKEALTILDGKLGNVIEHLKHMGHEFMVLAKSPWIGALAVLVGLYVGAKSAVEAYYTSSLEGETKLQEKQLKSEAFYKHYKHLWEEAGRSVSDYFSKVAGGWKLILETFSSKETQESIKETKTLAIQAAYQIAQAYIERTQSSLRIAELEIQVNKDLDISRDKVNKTSKERDAALKSAINNMETISMLQSSIAESDLRGEETRLLSLGKAIERGKLLSDYTQEELKATHLTAEEINKLRALQETVLKEEASALARRRTHRRHESELHNEFIREEEEKAQKAKEVQDRITEGERLAEQEELRLKKESDARKADLDKVKESNRKAGFDKWVADAQAANAKVDEDAQALFDAEMKRIADLEQARLDSLDLVGKSIRVAQEAIYVFMDFMSNASEYRQSLIKKEIKALDERTKRELKLAGDNEEAKIKIQESADKRREELEKKLSEEKNKQAKIQRAADIVQAGVTFSQAILAALAGGPPPFNLALAAITAAVAGIQVLAISSAPIPQFEQGGVSKGGLAIVGEKGTELMRHGNDFSLSPSGASLIDLKPGTEIYPHDETMRMLALSSIGSEQLIDRENNLRIQTEIKELQNIVARYSDKIVDAVTKGNGTLFQQGSLAYRIEKQSDGSKKMIRLKNLSE